MAACTALRVAAWVILAFVLPARATSVDARSLAELVCEADHALVATVVNVDMVDWQGRLIMNRREGTGPVSSNRIRLHLLVHSALFSTALEVPQRIVLEHWSAWHYQLGDVQDGSLGQDGIFLLKGERFEWVYPADFWRDPGERETIEALRTQCKPQSTVNPSGPESAQRTVTPEAGALTRSAPRAAPARP